jgi:hypothetical protein
MGMTSEQMNLYKAIDEILWNDWDPLGVNDVEEANDEYKEYTPTIFRLKIQGADREIIAKKLYEIVKDKMGLLGNIDHCRKVADKIINVK